LKALDENRTSIDYIDPHNPDTIVHLPLPNNTIVHRSNHVVPVAYDNATYLHQPGTIPDDDENMGKTYF